MLDKFIFIAYNQMKAVKKNHIREDLQRREKAKNPDIAKYVLLWSWRNPVLAR